MAKRTHRAPSQARRFVRWLYYPTFLKLLEDGSRSDSAPYGKQAVRANRPNWPSADVRYWHLADINAQR